MAKKVYYIKNWTCWDRVLSNIPRTTNNVEGWNRSFNDSCGVSHPNIAVLIVAMKDNEELNRAEILNCNANGIVIKSNLKREESLRLLLKNQKYLTDEEFFNLINKLFKW